MPAATLLGLIIVQLSWGTDTQKGLLPLPEAMIELTLNLVIASPFIGFGVGIIALFQKGCVRWLPVLAILLNSVWIFLIVQQLIQQGII